MFKTLEGPLYISTKTLPLAYSDVDLANNFLAFFVEKVKKPVQKSLLTLGMSKKQENGIELCHVLNNFIILMLPKLLVILFSKSCSLDIHCLRGL